MYYSFRNPYTLILPVSNCALLERQKFMNLISVERALLDCSAFDSSLGIGIFNPVRTSEAGDFALRVTYTPELSGRVSAVAR